jgi:hypothetical protein
LASACCLEKGNTLQRNIGLKGELFLLDIVVGEEMLLEKEPGIKNSRNDKKFPVSVDDD